MRKMVLLLALALVMADCGPTATPPPESPAPRIEERRKPDVRFGHDCPFFGDYCKDQMVWDT